MKRISLLLIAIIWVAVPGVANAQAPDTMWTRVYNEPLEQFAEDVCNHKGGYVIVGTKYVSPQNNPDIYLAKIDYMGDTLWTRMYGGPSNDRGFSVEPTSDGGLVVTGFKSWEVVLLKTDGNGQEVWQRTYEEIGWAYGLDVKQTADSGFVVAGECSDNNTNALILKTDPQGELLWHRNYGLSDEDKAFGVCELREGGFALVGFRVIQPGGHAPAWLIRLDSDGDSLWSRNYERGVCDFMAVEQTPDDGFIMAGRSDLYDGNWFDVYVVKVRINGDTVWTRTFGGSNWDGAFSVERTLDGNYFVGAYTHSFGGDPDYYFIKIDSLGNLLWQKVVGTGGYDWSLGATQCQDGGYIMVGRQEIFPQYEGDIFVVKLLPDQYSGNSALIINPESFSFSANFPNPFNSSTTISYSLAQAGRVTVDIYNVTGQKVARVVEGVQKAGEHKVVWDAKDVPSGVYFASLEAGERQETVRMILLK